MKKDKTDLIIDELIDAYAKDIAEEEFKEFAHYFEEDEQYLANKHLVENVRYEPATSKKKTSRFAKYVAAAAAVLIIFSVAIPTEASAWRIWDLRFLFDDNGDHTEIKPAVDADFPQYYVSAIPEDFDVMFENQNDSSIYIQYCREDDYIIFMQVKSEQFVSQLDKENRDFKEEIIGDFRIVVSQNDNDTIFESVTETSAIFIQTNAGYDIGKKFIESLEEK